MSKLTVEDLNALLSAFSISNSFDNNYNLINKGKPFDESYILRIINKKKSDIIPAPKITTEDNAKIKSPSEIKSEIKSEEKSEEKTKENTEHKEETTTNPKNAAEMIAPSILAMGGESDKNIEKYLKSSNNTDLNEFRICLLKINNQFEKLENINKIFEFLNKFIDFHLWYDDTSKTFTMGEDLESSYLKNIPINDNFSTYKKSFYGGDNERFTFYSLIIETVIKLLCNKTDFSVTDQQLYIMYCLGKNINYWLAKRYMMVCCGTIRPDIEDNLYSIIKSIGVKNISSNKYNEILKNINTDTTDKFILLYHYEIFKGYAETNDTINYLKGNDTDLYKKLLYLVFDRVKNTFYQDKKETTYAERTSDLNFAKPVPITQFIKTLSKDQNPKSLLQKQQEGKFFAVNTLKQIGTKYPGILRGGKMFCGGAEALYNCKDVYMSIFENIKKKMEEKKQNFNDADSKKIKALIDQLGKYEEIIYDILANMNKYVTSDMPQKHDAVNYEMMANAVDRYEKVMTKYNHKSFVLFKDLVKLNTFVQQLKVDVMRGDM